jgi:hypothetical protein
MRMISRMSRTPLRARALRSSSSICAWTARDQVDVLGVAALLRDDPRVQVGPHEVEVADQVEDLVADELVVPPRLVVDDPVRPHDQRVVVRGALPEARGLQRLDLAREAEGARAGDLLAEALSSRWTSKHWMLSSSISRL